MTDKTETIVVYDLQNPQVPVSEADRSLRSGVKKVVFDLTHLQANDPLLEELFLELEATFALTRKDITLLLAPEQKHPLLASFIMHCDVITSVAVRGAGVQADALLAFLKERVYATMHVALEAP